MEEENPNCTESLIGKLQELFTDSENDVGQFPFKEEMVEEFMQELYKEIACFPVPKPLSPVPTPTPLPSLPPSHHAPNPKHGIPQVTENDGPQLQVDEEEEKKMEQGFEEDEADFDDEWLARVLGWGQVLDTNQSGFVDF